MIFKKLKFTKGIREIAYFFLLGVVFVFFSADSIYAQGSRNNQTSSPQSLWVPVTPRLDGLHTKPKQIPSGQSRRIRVREGKDSQGTVHQLTEERLITGKAQVEAAIKSWGGKSTPPSIDYAAIEKKAGYVSEYRTTLVDRAGQETTYSLMFRDDRWPNPNEWTLWKYNTESRDFEIISKDGGGWKQFENLFQNLDIVMSWKRYWRQSVSGKDPNIGSEENILLTPAQVLSRARKTVDYLGH
jgi:hypothetical protein